MTDVEAVVFEGESTDRGIRGEYFVVIQGRRYDRDLTFRVSREACGSPDEDPARPGACRRPFCRYQPSVSPPSNQSQRT